MTEQTIQKDKLVTIDYAVLDNMGQIREENDMTLHYQNSQESTIFPRVIESLEGLKVGDEGSIELQPEEAYGPHNPELIFTDDIQNTPAEARQIGAELEAMNDAGEVRLFRVTRIEEGKVTADANHPLAGQVLTCKVNVKGVQDPN